MEAWEEAALEAEASRVLAEEYEQAEKAAKRLYDAKTTNEAPRPSLTGDKLKRRNNLLFLFGAGRMTYEAIIEFNQAQLKCAWAKRQAAEAKNAEVRAEMRLMELE